MSNSIPTADQALLQMFALLMAHDETVQVAEDLRALCEEWIGEGDRCTSGQMMVIVQKLRDAHPEHADHILELAVDTGV